MVQFAKHTNMATVARRLPRNILPLCRRAQCSRTLKTSTSHGSFRSNQSLYLCGVAAATSTYLGWKWLQGSAVVQAAKPFRRPVSVGYLVFGRREDGPGVLREGEHAEIYATGCLASFRGTGYLLQGRDEDKTA